jgi:hypothetical protein
MGYSTYNIIDNLGSSLIYLEFYTVLAIAVFIIKYLSFKFPV